MYNNVKLVRAAFADKPVITIDTSDVLVNVANETLSSSAPIFAVAGKSRIHAVGFYFDYKNKILNLHNQAKVTYVKEE